MIDSPTVASTSGGPAARASAGGQQPARVLAGDAAREAAAVDQFWQLRLGKLARDDAAARGEEE